MAEQEEEGLMDYLLQSWWGCLIVAAFFFGLAGVVYWYIGSIEERGGGRVNWIVALVYNWAGKIGTVCIFAIPGGIFALMGIWKLVSSGKNKDS